MSKDPNAETREIEFKLELMDREIEAINLKLSNQADEIEIIDKRGEENKLKITKWEGGLSWVHKSIFLVVALIGAFLSLAKYKG
jgi:hypothetical protein